MCIYLIAKIVSRRYTPISISDKSHSILLIGYITAAADIVDFADYNNDGKIINSLSVVDFIWSKDF